MLKTGAEHLEQLRDGRVVYIGGERVDDVTTHPAFRNAARSVAAIYDMKADPANHEAMSFAEGGERFSLYFLKPTARDDLARRMGAHRKIAEMSYGMLGRSPDHVASFVTGMAMDPAVFDADGGKRGYGRNLTAYYAPMRAHDTYSVYAVLPAPAARHPEFYQRPDLAHA